MSMYSLLRSSKGKPTQHEIEENLGGNLCRCTGYRPILDAFRVFAKSDDEAHTGKTKNENGEFLCPSTGKPCDCKSSKTNENGEHKHLEPKPKGTTDSFPVASAAEPIFPPELRQRKPQTLQLCGGLSGSTIWIRPTSLDELLDAYKKFPEAKIVGGNTEVGIEMRFKHRECVYLTKQ